MSKTSEPFETSETYNGHAHDHDPSRLPLRLGLQIKLAHAPTPTAPQPPHFSNLDMHHHPSHLASPQSPHLAPPPRLLHNLPYLPSNAQGNDLPEDWDSKSRKNWLKSPTTALQPQPFSTLDMRLYRPRFAPPQQPDPSPPPLLAPPALTRAKPESQPPTSHQPQEASRAHGATAQPLENQTATERKTKHSRLWAAEAAKIRHDLPEDWDSKLN
jgi:hypothetical protein